jgi:hypothetical protein
MRVPWTVEISQLDNLSVIVKVGCKSLAFESVDVALSELKHFFDDHEAVIKTYAERYGWADGAARIEEGRGFERSRNAGIGSGYQEVSMAAPGQPSTERVDRLR